MNTLALFIGYSVIIAAALLATCFALILSALVIANTLRDKVKGKKE